MVHFSEDVINAASAIFSRDEPLDFVICHFVDKNNMDVVNSGTGGVKDVAEILEGEDFKTKVVMGAFVVTALDEHEAVISVRKKVIHFVWTGPECKVMVRSKGATNAGEFRDIFPGAALYLQIKRTQQLDVEVLEKQLRAAGGAHQPSSFDFTNASV